jgi:hypothetical protein
VGAFRIFKGDTSAKLAKNARARFEVVLLFRKVEGSRIKFKYATGDDAAKSYALTAIINDVHSRTDRLDLAGEIKKALTFADDVLPDENWDDGLIEDKNGFQCGAPEASWFAVSSPTKPDPSTEWLMEVDIRTVVPYIFSCVGKSAEQIESMSALTRVLPYDYDQETSNFLDGDGKPLETRGETKFALDGDTFEYRIVSYDAGTVDNGWKQELTLHAYRGAREGDGAGGDPSTLDGGDL